MSSKKKVPDWKLVVREALAFLRRRGAWTQYSLGYERDGSTIRKRDNLARNLPPRENIKCLCAHGALILGGTTIFPDDGHRARLAVVNARIEFENIVGEYIENWNDDDRRKKRQVIEVLDELAA